MAVLLSMARQEVDAARTGMSGAFDIMRMVANHERAGEINVVVTRRLMEEKGVWFDTGACVFTAVRADVDVTEGNTFGGKNGQQMLVNTLDIGK